MDSSRRKSSEAGVFSDIDEGYHVIGTRGGNNIRLRVSRRNGYLQKAVEPPLRAVRPPVAE